MKSHSFKAPPPNSLLRPDTCLICKKGVMSHTAFAECEACGRKPCVVEVVGNILLCEDCERKENIALLERPKTDDTAYPNGIPETIQKLENDRFNKPSDIVARIVSSSIHEDLPQNGDEFFNAETVSHISLHDRVMADESIPKDKKWYFFVEQLQFRQKHLQVTLAEGIKVINEIRSRSASVQRDLNMLVSKLRTEERAALKLQDINYTSPKPPIKVLTPRMSAKEHAIVAMAKLLYAPRKDGVIQWEALPAEEREDYMNKARNTFQGNLSDIKSVDGATKKKKEG